VYTDNPVTFLNVEQRIPDIYVFPDRVLRRFQRPRIVKSHECFDFRYNKIIYIVRHPRDVAVSLYHHYLKAGVMPDGYPMEEFVRLFIAGSENGFRWGPWGDHVLSWWSTRGGRDGFLFVRYEDILKDPKRELAKMASLLSIDISEEGLARTVELSSAGRMRSLEKKQSRGWVGTTRTRQDKTFVRSARPGDWRSALPEQSSLEIETAWGLIMQNLGYELTIKTAKCQAVFEPKVAAFDRLQGVSQAR